MFSAHDRDLLAAAADVFGGRLAALPPLLGADEARPGNIKTDHLSGQGVSCTKLPAGSNPSAATREAHLKEEISGERVAPAVHGPDDTPYTSCGGVAGDEDAPATCSSFPAKVTGSGLEDRMGTSMRLETVPEEEEDEEKKGMEVSLQCLVDTSKFEVALASMTVGLQRDRLELDGEAAPAPAGQLEGAYGWAEAAGLQVDEMFTVARQAEGLFHYDPQEPDELAVRPGQRISLLGLAQPGWYLADIGDSHTDASAAGGSRRFGLVPSNFIRLC